MQIMHPAEHVRVIFDYVFYFESPEALENCGQRSVRHLEGLDDPGDSTVGVKIFFLWVFYRHVKLRYRTYVSVVFLRILDKPDRLLPSYSDRVDGPREEHGIPQCQYRHRIRQFGFVDLHGAVPLHYRYYADFSAHRGQDIFDIAHILYLII